MREIVLDTETTGFSPGKGDRLVEIGCVELVNHMPTGTVYHCYINPERDMPESAFKVHGLSEEFLSDKPLFKDVCDEFLEFVNGSPMVIHNAEFDVKFLNAELDWVGKPVFPQEQAIDTLVMARKKFPGASVSLDALCRRFGVDNSNRELHGALIDSYLLAEVYLELIGGRQPGFVLEQKPIVNMAAVKETDIGQVTRRQRPTPLATRLSEEAIDAHKKFVADELGDESLWHRSS